MSAFFITFEGTEGTGKSTQLGLLAEALRLRGERVRELREPGGTKLSEEIRHLVKNRAAGLNVTPEAELLLMNAARAQLVREVIRPALAAGEIVLCDRYFDSTLAYQGWGRGMDVAWVERVVEFAVGPTRPDLTLLLCVPAEVSQKRQRQREAATDVKPDRFETAGQEFFDRVEAGYREIARREPARVRCIDATASVQEVHQSIWRIVQQRLRI